MKRAIERLDYRSVSLALAKDSAPYQQAHRQCTCLADEIDDGSYCMMARGGWVGPSAVAGIGEDFQQSFFDLNQADGVWHDASWAQTQHLHQQAVSTSMNVM